MFYRTYNDLGSNILKDIMLKELNLSKNICFNKISETDSQISITKSNHKVGTTTEISEICNIQSKLEKYKQYFSIHISIDEVIIRFK